MWVCAAHILSDLEITSFCSRFARRQRCLATDPSRFENFSLRVEEG